MSERLTNILGYLTLFAILGAIWVLFGEDPTLEQGGRGEPTFVGMKDSINDVTGLILMGGGQQVSLTRSEDGWAIAERNGYAADADKVREFLRGVALSERREPKTANTDRFDRLGLGSAALKVRLEDGNGSEMLAFDMGKRSAIGSDRSLTYVWQASDTRSWLVTALQDGTANPADWLDTDLIDIAPARVKAVSLGGARLVRALGETAYRLDDIKEGEAAAPTWRLGEPARVITGLQFEDVRHLGNPLTDPLRSVELVTHDGLVLSLMLHEMDGATWAQLSARHDAALMSEGEAGTLPEAPADGVAEAEAMTNAARGWFFRLSAADAAVLTKDRGDFLEATQADGSTAP